MIQLLGSTKTFFILLVGAFAFAKPSITASDDALKNRTFKTMSHTRTLSYGGGGGNQPTSNKLGDSENLTKIFVESTTDPTDLVYHFPDVYVGADRVNRVYFGDLFYQTYGLTFTSKNPKKVLIGVGYVNENNLFVGQLGDYTMTGDDDILLVVKSTEFIVICLQTVSIDISEINWRPVIVSEDNITVKVTSRNSELKIIDFGTNMQAVSGNVAIKKLESVMGRRSNLGVRITSSTGFLSLGIGKENRWGRGYNVARFIEGYFSDGERFWMNPNYANDEFQQNAGVNEETTLSMVLQYLNESITMIVWKEGSQTAHRLRLNSDESVGFNFEIWALYQRRTRLAEFDTVSAIPATVKDVCIGDHNCGRNDTCDRGDNDVSSFRAGTCALYHRTIGEGTFHSESYINLYNDVLDNTFYNHYKRRRMSPHRAHRTCWAVSLTALEDNFTGEVYDALKNVGEL